MSGLKNISRSKVIYHWLYKKGPIRKESHFTCSHNDHLFHGKMTPAAWLLVATKTLDLRTCDSATDDLRIPQIQMIYRTLCIHERLFLEAKTTLEVGTAKSSLQTINCPAVSQRVRECMYVFLCLFVPEYLFVCFLTFSPSLQPTNFKHDLVSLLKCIVHLRRNIKRLAKDSSEHRLKKRWT